MSATGPLPDLCLDWLPGRFAVCRLDPDAPAPSWATAPGALVSLTRTGEELSIVTPEARVPLEQPAEHGWRALRVAGPLDFSLVGILATLSGALARAGVPVFAISTYDTDYLLVKAEQTAAAAAALSAVARVSGQP